MADELYSYWRPTRQIPCVDLREEGMGLIIKLNDFSLFFAWFHLHSQIRIQKQGAHTQRTKGR